MFVLTASPVLRWAGTKNKGTWLGPEASRAGAATLGWISSWKTQLMSHCPRASPTHTHTHTHTPTHLQQTQTGGEQTLGTQDLQFPHFYLPGSSGMYVSGMYVICMCR